MVLFTTAVLDSNGNEIVLCDGCEAGIFDLYFTCAKCESDFCPFCAAEARIDDAKAKSAVAGETHEYTEMYPGMAKTAREEGFDEIADWFETLAKAEKSHAGRFEEMLDSIS